MEALRTARPVGVLRGRSYLIQRSQRSKRNLPYPSKRPVRPVVALHDRSELA